MKPFNLLTLREMQLLFPAHHTMKLYIHKELESDARDLPGFYEYRNRGPILESMLSDDEKQYGPRLAIGQIERMMICLVETIEKVDGGYTIIAQSELDSTRVSEVVVGKRHYGESSFFTSSDSAPPDR